MTIDVANQYIAWIIALITLVACWPIAQSLRHEKLHPLAAYLLFVSILALVSTSVFWVLIVIGRILVGPSALEGVGPAVITVLASLVPGGAAAVWIVRRPQVRRMPK